MTLIDNTSIFIYYHSDSQDFNPFVNEECEHSFIHILVNAAFPIRLPMHLALNMSLQLISEVNFMKLLTFWYFTEFLCDSWDSWKYSIVAIYTITTRKKTNTTKSTQQSPKGCKPFLQETFLQKPWGQEREEDPIARICRFLFTIPRNHLKQHMQATLKNMHVDPRKSKILTPLWLHPFQRA